MLQFLLNLVLIAAVVYLYRNMRKLQAAPPVVTDLNVQRMYRIAHDTLREHESEKH